jgi:hypothetical protein
VDPKPVVTPPRKVTTTDKRSSAAQSASLRRSIRGLKSDDLGPSSPKQDGREPFKSPVVLTGTKDNGKKKAGPGRPAKKSRNAKL